eukprot:350572-Chlamydomonas_euryale.AAC.12
MPPLPATSVPLFTLFPTRCMTTRCRLPPPALFPIPHASQYPLRPHNRRLASTASTRLIPNPPLLPQYSIATPPSALPLPSSSSVYHTPAETPKSSCLAAQQAMDDPAVSGDKGASSEGSTAGPRFTADAWNTVPGASVAQPDAWRALPGTAHAHQDVQSALPGASVAQPDAWRALPGSRHDHNTTGAPGAIPHVQCHAPSRSTPTRVEPQMPFEPTLMPGGGGPSPWALHVPLPMDDLGGGAAPSRAPLAQLPLSIHASSPCAPHALIPAAHAPSRSTPAHACPHLPLPATPGECAVGGVGEAPSASPASSVQAA